MAEDADFFVSAAAFSASGSYPNLAIRSASSFALFSTSSKSMASDVVTFLAPNFGAFFDPNTLPFLALAAVVLRTAGFDRTATGGDDAEVLSSEPERGDFGRALPLPLAPALRNGEPVRLTTGGVVVREGGLLGRLIAGLSHDEKKSSSPSPAGVEAPSEVEAGPASVMTTSFGYLKIAWFVRIR